MTLEQVQAHLSEMRAACARPEVLLAYLYGSVVTGHAWSESDLDCGLLLSDDIPAAQHWRVAADVAGELSHILGFPRVDVRTLNDAPVYARFEVIRHGRCVYARDESLRIGFETAVTVEYLDFLPVIRQHDRAVLERAMEKRYGSQEQRAQRDAAAALRNTGASR